MNLLALVESFRRIQEQNCETEFVITKDELIRLMELLHLSRVSDYVFSDAIVWIKELDSVAAK